MTTREAMEAKRTDVLTEAKGLRKYPGTGFHDNDATGPVKHPDPVGRRDAKLEDHVIAFKRTFEFVFIPPDSERVVQAVSHYFDEFREMLKETRLDTDQRRWIETAQEYAGIPLQDGCFVCRAQQWNDLLVVLHFAGLGVTCTAV